MPNALVIAALTLLPMASMPDAPRTAPQVRAEARVSATIVRGVRIHEDDATAGAQPIVTPRHASRPCPTEDQQPDGLCRLIVFDIE